MEKIYAYDAKTQVILKTGTKQGVAIRGGKRQAPAIQIQFPLERAVQRLIGRWYVDFMQESLHMVESDFPMADEGLSISFQEEMVDITLQYTHLSLEQTETIEHVKSVAIYPHEVGQIKVITHDVPTKIREEQKNVPEETVNIPKDAELEEVKAELELAKNTSELLQKMLDTRIDELLKHLMDNKKSLSTSNLKKLDEIQALKEEGSELDGEIEASVQKVKKLETEIKEKKVERENIQKQVDKLGEQKEFLELDCEQAGKDLQRLREQLELDADTLSLIEDDSFLKHGSISKTLDKVEKELQSVEKKIALIIKFRTKFNEKVEQAIFNGDGRILDIDEMMDIEKLGGTADGDGSTTSEKDA